MSSSAVSCDLPADGIAPSDAWYSKNRLGGLRRFAGAITILNILGHLYLGFEQSWAQPFVAVAAAYSTELLVLLCTSVLGDCRQRSALSAQSVIDFFLPSHISAMACSMLLYTGDALAPTAFAASVAVASKHIIRINGRHVFNPSNFGITVTLLAFSWVGIAQPYQFTENLNGFGDWILPSIIVVSGTFLNWRFTKRLPLIVAWLATFALQALVRHSIFGSQLAASLLPMTGVAFILYSFYMVTDPPTTPSSVRGQIAFGASVGAMYGVLMSLNVVFTLFFALTAVSAIRLCFLALHRVVTSRDSVSKQRAKSVGFADRGPWPHHLESQPLRSRAEESH